MRAQQNKTGTAVSITLLLAFCLLFAQCLGLTHSIAHAHPAGTAQLASGDAKATSSFLHDTSTSCAAYDEACVGAALQTPTYSPPLLPGAATLSLWLAFQSWQQPFRHLFSSRAPPAA